jgi:ABC-type nitrate/sulfonate/bicarbonate transport system substrate-binding protein
VPRLRVMLFRSAYNLPVTAGIERGVFARGGLDVEIGYTRGSKMVTETLLAGGAEVGVLSADDIVYEVETHGADLFVFMGLHRGILTLVARPGVRGPADLRGARLGVDDPASGFALVAHRILGDLGLRRDDYETVAAGGHELRARALLEGTIDLALLTSPFTEQALARGFTLLARARDHVPAYQASCGVTTRQWAASHADTLVAYIRAYREAVRWVLDPSNYDAMLAHLAREFALDADLAARTYTALSDPDDGLFRDAAIDVAGVQTVLDLRAEAKLLPSPPPNPARYCDPTYLERAAVTG